MRGFCRMRVLLSVSSAWAVAEATDTAKSVALRCANWKRVGLVELLLAVQVVLPVGQVVEELLDVGGCRVTPTLPGHEIPRLRSQFLLTSSTAMSTTTSGRALSRSLTSFCASRS